MSQLRDHPVLSYRTGLSLA